MFFVAIMNGNLSWSTPDRKILVLENNHAFGKSKIRSYNCFGGHNRIKYGNWSGCVVHAVHVGQDLDFCS